MGIGIVIKNKPEKYGIIRSVSQAARRKVSRENRQEYDNEKRAIEISNRMPCGHPDAKAVAIAKMMNTDEHKIKNILRKSGHTKVILDGKID